MEGNFLKAQKNSGLDSFNWENTTLGLLFVGATLQWRRRLSMGATASHYDRPFVRQLNIFGSHSR